MKIGYPCINRQIGCQANSTFRLKNYSEERLISYIQNNLDCLKQILGFNIANKLLFFRISSNVIPFASHPVCKFDWRDYFSKNLKLLGEFIKKNNIRISMHPDQFVLINALSKNIIKKSIAELSWHGHFLDALNLDNTAKIQIHVGGIYGDKLSAMKRFIQQYEKLPDYIRTRLAIENDDRLFSLTDCKIISEHTGIPIIFDYLHFQCKNNDELFLNAFESSLQTWKKTDGLMMIDYSSQEPFGRKGKHAQTIDENDFAIFLEQTKNFDFDIMLEIKDKEQSALKALKVMQQIRMIND